MEIDYTGLAKPFAPSDIEWRIGQAGKKSDGSVWAKVLAYVTARAIEDRLDSVVGPQNWKNEFCFVTGGVLCGISIFTENGWITKWDGSDPSDIEAFKGSISGAMKRAAVQWGIGRYLYELGETRAQIVDQRVEGAHYASCKVKVKGTDEWVQFHWLPPRDALKPAAETPPPPADKAKSLPAKPAGRTQAKAVAQQHGMKTADELVPPMQETTYQKAIKEIEKAVRTHDKAYLAKIGKLAAERKADGHLSESEDAALLAQLQLAEKQIDAVLNQEAAA